MAGPAPSGTSPISARPAQSEPRIRECAGRLLAGDALRSICIDLNERGVPTVKEGGGVPDVAADLMSGRISGQRDHHGEIVAAAEWAAIISPAESKRFARLLGDPDRRTNRVARRYLLARLLRCGFLRGAARARPRADGARPMCGERPGLPWLREIYKWGRPVGVVHVEAVLHRLDSPELAAR